MPMYSYHCVRCTRDETHIAAIADRDSQTCRTCGCKLKRGIDRPGMVWAPTTGRNFAL